MITAFLADARRHYRNYGYKHPRDGIRIFLGEYGLQALFAYRFGKCLLAANSKWYAWPLLPFGWIAYFLMSRYVRLAFGIRLELSAAIGPGLYIGHFGNIMLRRCVLGANCSISHSVHIHPAEGSDQNAGPQVGNNIWMGAHAQVVGPYRIGDGSTISAAANVKRDIPDNSLCMGDPARVAMRDYDNSALLGI